MSIQLTAKDSRALTKLLEKKEKIERAIEKIMGGGLKRKAAKAGKKPKTAKEKEAAENRRAAQQKRREREAKEKAKEAKA